MTGRGGGKLLRPAADPSVKIGLSVSISPANFSIKSNQEINVIVTARILTTPHPDKAITLWTHLSPLDGLNTRAFTNIICKTNPSKRIEIWPRGWPQYHWDSEDIQDPDHFVTIPPRDHGSLKIQHTVPQGAIQSTGLSPGESYTVSLTDLCLGTKWWCCGTVADLDGHRLRQWRSTESLKAEAREEEMLDDDLKEVLRREREDKYGTRPSLTSEDPSMLAMISEVGTAEFVVTD